MITLISGAAVLAIVLFLIVRGYATQIAQNGQDNILSASVSSLLDAAVVQDGTVEVDFPYSSFSMLDTELDDRVFYGIYQDGRLLSGYEDLPRPSLKDGERRSFQTLDYAGTTVRLASAKRTLVGATGRTEISVSIAQTQDALSQTLGDISQTVTLFGTGFFLLIVLLSYWATTVTINPLMRLAMSVQRRGPQDLSPFRKEVPSEMVPLVSSLNTLMGRLDHSLTQSEDFIAEAAHRVRTPLATVRSYADATLQRVTKKQNRDALRSMVRAIDESSRAASQLLDHAMITFRADHLEKKQIDLVALVQELVVRLAPIAEMKDVTLDFAHDDVVTTKGDLILLQNAIRNLIDNALKYAPNESDIYISVKSDPNPNVMVLDQGPGYPVEDFDNLTTRFARGKNADGVVGSGLGLTIAKDVAVAHDGDLLLSNHEKGGACAILSL
jgi:two-component system sensor histidine kinase TctE